MTLSLFRDASMATLLWAALWGLNSKGPWSPFCAPAQTEFMLHGVPTMFPFCKRGCTLLYSVMQVLLHSTTC